MKDTRSLELVRVACARAGISRAELARRLGTTPSAFDQRLRTGRLSLSELENLAKVLGGVFSYEIEFDERRR
jgi:transcriptional regulator with XRE-family HTH domain